MILFFCEPPQIPFFLYSQDIIRFFQEKRSKKATCKKAKTLDTIQLKSDTFYLQVFQY